MNAEDKREFLKKKGWFPWRNDGYWCHERFTTQRCDCKEWGLILEDAYAYETNKKGREMIDKHFKLKQFAEEVEANVRSKCGAV